MRTLWTAITRLVFVGAPALALWMSIPIAALPLEAFRASNSENLPGWIAVALPTYFGLLAAPGYLFVLFRRPTAASVSRRTRLWVRASLAMALACAAAGLWGSTLMWLFGPPSLLSGIAAGWLWWHFERGGWRRGLAMDSEAVWAAEFFVVYPEGTRRHSVRIWEPTRRSTGEWGSEVELSILDEKRTIIFGASRDQALLLAKTFAKHVHEDKKLLTVAGDPFVWPT